MSSARLLTYQLHRKDEEGKFSIPQDGYFNYMTPVEATEMNGRELSYETTEFDWGTAENIVRRFASAEYQWLRYRNPSWRIRELGYFGDNTYVRPDWNLVEIPDHYPYLTSDGKRISYFVSPEKGMVDDRTEMKVGRYLTRFYDHLSGDEVREIVCRIEQLVTVQFAATEDEIEEVYTTGPSSCMAHRAEVFEAPFHPVRVYAGGDLQVAYLKNSAGKVAARALVWPEKRIYVRIYGDFERLKRSLEDLGFVQGTPIGARIRKVEYDDYYYVAPYVDYATTLNHDPEQPDFLIVDGPGKLACSAAMTSGISERPRTYICPIKGTEHTSSSEMHFIADLDQWWSRDAADEGAFYCNYDAVWYSSSVPRVQMEGGFYWSRNRFDSRGFTCPRSGQRVSRSDTTVLVDTQERVSEYWAAENSFYDPDTYHYYLTDPNLIQEAA